MNQLTQRLKAIEARCEAALEGPWYPNPVPTSSNKQIVCDGGRIAQSDHVDDALFIAHARQDVPALIAVVRELSGALADITQEPWSMDPSIKSSDIAMKALKTAETLLGGE